MTSAGLGVSTEEALSVLVIAVTLAKVSALDSIGPFAKAGAPSILEMHQLETGCNLAVDVAFTLM